MKRKPILPDRPRPLFFAHRGASSLAPENTMAAFSLARKLGSPGIELDIHVCASGELVVAHDDTFQRTASDPRNIGDLSLREIRAIDIGSYLASSFCNERAPLLEEVLEEFCPGMYIDIELKTKKVSGDSLPELAAKKLMSMGEHIRNAVSVSSFNPVALRNFKKAFPGIPTALIWSRSPEVPRALRQGAGRWIASCDYFKPEYAQVTPGAFFLRGKPGANRAFIPWTIDEPGMAEEMVKRGAEGIITNRPQDMPAGWKQ